MMTLANVSLARSRWQVFISVVGRSVSENKLPIVDICLPARWQQHRRPKYSRRATCSGLLNKERVHAGYVSNLSISSWTNFRHRCSERYFRQRHDYAWSAPFTHECVASTDIDLLPFQTDNLKSVLGVASIVPFASLEILPWAWFLTNYRHSTIRPVSSSTRWKQGPQCILLLHPRLPPQSRTSLLSHTSSLGTPMYVYAQRLLQHSHTSLHDSLTPKMTGSRISNWLQAKASMRSHSTMALTRGNLLGSPMHTKQLSMQPPGSSYSYPLT
jgi:hypothetical protein